MASDELAWVVRVEHFDELWRSLVSDLRIRGVFVQEGELSVVRGNLVHTGWILRVGAGRTVSVAPGVERRYAKRSGGVTRMQIRMQEAKGAGAWVSTYMYGRRRQNFRYVPGSPHSTVMLAMMAG